MYNNVGRKLMGLAIFSMIAELIIFLIIGGSFMREEDTVFIGLLIIGVGFLFSWVSSLMLYGFGQLVDNSDIVAKTIKNIPNHTTPVADDKKYVVDSFSQFSQVVDSSDIPLDKKSIIKDIRKMKDQKLISEQECRKRISKELSNVSLTVQLEILERI